MIPVYCLHPSLMEVQWRRMCSAEQLMQVQLMILLSFHVMFLTRVIVIF